ncbi:uroporphyrin-III C-methyltransferase/precorrin-2 dehydrogenase/sirohydrochlorin ferrochelatase [Novosphingobium kunmingense]|uniref:precorrin-2 dehydrogenase n=1 Tax=Novosphingobium kunmingense TaxID=1211806 RepID=A0A2N0I4B3_9SPHN|nr:NAD(P)-dependent oxidoreductase [Novosphingobium kunmingense]PKB25996.1 uroporphyrin-III C-methyltransferase/precorrin-2 dehydrogenase/sirohydrochlorin ferrochelatase [Novosphingobium kunmingense]
MHSLPLFHRVAGQPVIVVGEGEAAAAKARLIERAGGTIVGAASKEARLAFVALDDPDEAAAALKARGLLVNVADRPDLCDFTLPSVLDRDPVLIAVSTGGASAGLAKVLRLRLEQMLPASLGRLASGLAAAREAMRRRWPEAGARRHALDAALAPGGPLDPLDQAAADRIDEWLERDSLSASQTIEITLASDDPDDLTLRQARWLGSADAILCDDNFAPQILARSRADALRLPVDAAPPADARLTLILRTG